MASLRKRGRVWYYRFVDSDGVKRERKGCSDRRATEDLARAAESQAAKVRAGLIDPKALRIAEANREPIATHVAAYLASLAQAQRKPKHIVNTRAALARVLALAKIERLPDLTPSALVPALAKLKEAGYAPRTIEAHIIAVKSFSRWAWRDGRAADYALVGLVKPGGPMERRRVRRPLTDAELRSLIDTTRNAPAWRGMSGLDRSMLYAVASMTGLRRGELRSLTPESFRLGGEPPTIVCEAGYTKNGQLAEQPIPASLVDVLKPWIAAKPPRRPVFERMTDWTALMLRLDLERCGIPHRDEDGRVVDLHALRHTYITALGKAGLPLKVHQTLARHADPKLTLNVYSHLTIHDTAQAVQSLPDPFRSAPGAEASAAVATGTDGRNAANQLAHHLPTGGDGRGGNEKASEGMELRATLPLSSSLASEMRAPDGTGWLGLQETAGKKGSSKKATGPITDRIPEPRNTSANSDLRDLVVPVAHHLPTGAFSGDPGLAEVIEAWPGLPQAIRDGIRAMVQASRGGKPRGG